MSDEITALLLGTLLGVGALAYVLYPLFFDAGHEAAPPPLAAAETPLDIEARVAAYRAARRACVRCGLRPEPDAVYCSTCGVALPAAPPA